MANSNNPYAFPATHQDQSSFNQNYLKQLMPNSEDITDPTTAMNMALILMAKAFKLNYSTPTNNNQRISSNPKNRQIAQPGMNMGQDRQMQIVGGNGRNQFRQYAGQNAGNPTRYNDVIGNQNQIGNGNLVAARAEGNAAGQNRNQMRCYNCRGVGHYARNCTVRPRRRDVAYLQTQLLIAQKEEAGIQLQAEDKHQPQILRLTTLPSMIQMDQLRVQNVRNQNGLIGVQGNGNQNQIGNGNLVAARAEGNAAGQNRNQIRCYNCRGVGHYARNCTVRPKRRDVAYLQTKLLIAQKEEAGIQLQQASTSGTQTDNAPVYDTDGSAEVHENCDDNEIFNMFTQEEQYTELLEPIPESHQVPHNENDGISEDTSVEQSGETVEQHPTNFEETRALYESLYQNLAIEVEKVNS
nr:hypothetical protein [Tanacetum cinerariifolium]